MVVMVTAKVFVMVAIIVVVMVVVEVVMVAVIVTVMMVVVMMVVTSLSHLLNWLWWCGGRSEFCSPTNPPTNQPQSASLKASQVCI